MVETVFVFASHVWRVQALENRQISPGGDVRVQLEPYDVQKATLNSNKVCILCASMTKGIPGPNPPGSGEAERLRLLAKRSGEATSFSTCKERIGFEATTPPRDNGRCIKGSVMLMKHRVSEALIPTISRHKLLPDHPDVPIYRASRARIAQTGSSTRSPHGPLATAQPVSVLSGL